MNLSGMSLKVFSLVNFSPLKPTKQATLIELPARWDKHYFSNQLKHPNI
jgi:hypothetical protein